MASKQIEYELKCVEIEVPLPPLYAHLEYKLYRRSRPAGSQSWGRKRLVSTSESLDQIADSLLKVNPLLSHAVRTKGRMVRQDERKVFTFEV